MIRRAISGESAARESLTPLARQRVRQWCLRLLRNEDAIEDAAQDVLVRMWQHLHSVNEAEAFWSWLYSITLNVLRARSRQPTWSSLDFDPVSPQAEDSLREARAELRGLLQMLPAAEREILELRYGLDLSGAEIAAKTGISHGAARVRLHRALEHLRSLAKRFQGPVGNKSDKE